MVPNPYESPIGPPDATDVTKSEERPDWLDMFYCAVVAFGIVCIVCVAALLIVALVNVLELGEAAGTLTLAAGVGINFGPIDSAVAEIARPEICPVPFSRIGAQRVTRPKRVGRIFRST